MSMTAAAKMTAVRIRLGEIAAALALLSVGCSPDTTDNQTPTKTPTVSAGGAATATAGATSTATAGAAGASTTPSGVFSGPGVGTAGASKPVATAAGSGGPKAGAPPAPAVGAAGAPAPATAGAAAPSGAAGAMADTTPPTTGDGPPLPAIMGECPEFRDGTIMVAGHKSIQIKAGAAGKGGPLLFYWHGTGSSAAESNGFPGNSEIISSGGVIAAFNGSQSSKQGGDCSGTSAHYKADFNAADQIAACAAKNHGIDSRRIYSTGCSAGGLQSGCMAQVRSSYLAAVAPNSGGVVFPQAWQDKHSPAVFTQHGGSSDVVIVTFSETSATFDMSAKAHGSFVVNCDHGGGHCAAPAALKKASWQFMKDHPWGVTTSPWASGFPADVPSYCKIY